MKVFFPLLMIVFLVCGCKSEQVALNNYFPLAPGNSWTYEKILPGEQLLYQVGVGSYEKIDGVTCSSLSYFVNSGSESLQTEYFENNQDITKRATKWPERSISYTPPIVFLPKDVKSGDKWEWSGTVEDRQLKLSFVASDGGKQTLKKKDYENCLLVTMTDQDKMMIKKWYCPGIGLVKEEVSYADREEILVSVIVDYKLVNSSAD